VLFNGRAILERLDGNVYDGGITEVIRENSIMCDNRMCIL